MGVMHDDRCVSLNYPWSTGTDGCSFELTIHNLIHSRDVPAGALRDLFCRHHGTPSRYLSASAHLYSLFICNYRRSKQNRRMNEQEEATSVDSTISVLVRNRIRRQPQEPQPPSRWKNHPTPFRKSSRSHVSQTRLAPQIQSRLRIQTLTILLLWRSKSLPIACHGDPTITRACAEPPTKHRERESPPWTWTKRWFFGLLRSSFPVV